MTTLAQIVLAAQAAANQAATLDAYGQQTTKLNEFAAAGFDHADFGQFENAFNSQLEMITNFSKQDSPATRAAKLAAAQ